jgi:hypothetical protein
MLTSAEGRPYAFARLAIAEPVSSGEPDEALTSTHALVRATFPPCPREDSNLRTRLRRPVLYPLSYEGGTSQITIVVTDLVLPWPR